MDNEGDMNRILEYVLFSDPSDEPRFEEIITKWIDTKEVPAFEKYVKEPQTRKDKRKKKVTIIIILSRATVLFFSFLKYVTFEYFVTV